MIVDFALGHLLTGFPHDGARAGALALVPAVEHWPARQHDGWNVDGRSPHDQSRCGLVAAGGENEPIEGITIGDLNQRQVREVTIERRRWPLAGFLHRMHWKFERHAASFSNAIAHAVSEENMVPVAR